MSQSKAGGEAQRYGGSTSSEVESIAPEAASTPPSPPKKKKRKKSFPLSFGQQRLWVLDQLEPGSPLYNVPGALRLSGQLNVSALERSLGEIVARHEALRTTFAQDEGLPVQRIGEAGAVPLEVVDLSRLESAARGAELQRLGSEEARKPFDLSRGPLLRARLLKLEPTEHVLLLTMHHIVSDAWSVGVCFRELGVLYSAFSLGQPSPLTPLAVQYVDYTLWQRQWLQGEVLDKQLAYWKTQLAGVEPLDLKTDRPRGPMQGARGALHRFSLSRELMEGLKALSRKQGTTLFMTLLAGFNALLARYTRQQDIVVGTSVANRGRAEIEGLIGFFINTLALRTQVDGNPRFTELLERVRKVTLEAYTHQETPFDRVVEAVQPERDLTRTPLFQVFFELQNAPLPKVDLPGLQLSLADLETGTAKFDLAVGMSETPDGLQATVEYNTELYERKTVERLMSHYQVLLKGAVEQPEKRLWQLPVLGEGERRTVLEKWNQTGREEGPELFCELFEKQVEKTPEAVAVVCGEQALSYRQLNAQANRVAHALKARGAGLEKVVGVVQERGVGYLVSLLGVLKADAVYLPLDPALPAPRLAGLVKQSGCQWVLSEEKTRGLAQEIAQGQPVLEREGVLAEGRGEHNPKHEVEPKSLAYVLYTSGSTGVPKGAMIEHRGMKNHLMAKVRDLGMGPEEVVAQVAVQSFDVSVWQFLSALLSGGRTAVFPDESAWEPQKLLKEMGRQGVTLLETVPAHMKLILEELEARPNEYDVSALKWFFLNGEALPAELCQRWFERYPGIPMVNAYGPTECSDDVTHYKMMKAPQQKQGWMPIHGTLPNLQLYVVDEWIQPVPLGVPGELCVGGVGVGRGYLGDAVKTAGSYVPNPFASQAGERLYRTGDLVRCLEDGTLEFLGRNDHQVKIRGIRIELGEIEAALRKHPQVGMCVVVARAEGQGKRLVGYVSAKEAGAQPTGKELTEYLKGQLTAAMVPSAMVVMEALPLTHNGKVDRKALPAPEKLQSQETDEIVEPRTPLESQIAAQWKEVLGVQRVGVHDNFFDLGGHSLVAIQIISRLRKSLEIDLSIREFFDHQTVEELARYLEQKRLQGPGSGADTGPGALLRRHPLAKLPPQENYPLAALQLPEWYMYELLPDSSFYNVTVGDVQLVGDVNLPAFTRAWQTLFDRHTIFRTWFAYENGVPVHRVLPRLEITQQDIYLDRRDVPEDRVDEEVALLVGELSNAPFDLKQPPIFRVKLAEFPGKRFQFVFATHHIVWDETSTMSMARELSELYRAYHTGTEPVLPALSIDYLDYAHWLNSAIQGGHLEDQRQYWLRQLTPVPPAMDLPTDFPRPSMQTFNGDTLTRVMPPEVRAAVDPFLASNNLTPFIYLLAVLNLQLHRLTSQSDFVIGTPIANRADESLEPVLGLFATALPMRCRVSPALTFQDLLKQTRETALQGFDNHLYPSVLSIQEVNPQMDLSRNRLFSVMYGVQNNKTKLANDLRFEGLELRYLTSLATPEFKNARFDLTFIVEQFGNDMIVSLNYNSDLFLRTSVERMLEQFFSLAAQTARNPGKRLADYAMLSAEAEDHWLDTLAGPPLAFEQQAGLPARLSAQARATPDAVAIAHDDGSLTYRALDEASDRWARWLVSQGVHSEERVAVLLEPSLDLAIALWGILKAGAAYVPLNPDHPAERHEHVLTQAGVRTVLTHGHLSAPALHNRPGVFRMEEHAAQVSALPTGAPVHVRADQLAYVLYTSGTTGAPRGIEISHLGVHNLIDSTQREYNLQPGEAVLFITPVDFDASVLDFFWPLAFGARVVLPLPGENKDPSRIAARIARYQVAAFQTVPLMLDALVHAQKAGELPPLPSLRLIICGGAYLTRELHARAQAALPCLLANHYGPTEVTVDATRFPGGQPGPSEVVSIGRPLDNTQMRVLDPALRLVPPAVKGELFVSSPGLARCYSGDPVRTALQFVPDPYSEVPGARLYRTGDLGRYSEEGLLHYVARVDKQVKIRGNRVELEEVEGRLAAHPAVNRCLVRHQQAPGGTDTLVAYLELKERFVRLGDDRRYRLFSLAQRPELRRAMDTLHAESWPEYFMGNCAVRTFWPRLMAEFPECQLAVLDEHDTVVATGNAIPFQWDGTLGTLPPGWDAALEQAFAGAALGARPNTLIMLAAVVGSNTLGQGMSSFLLNALKHLGHAQGMERLIVPVRPVDKAARPHETAEEYCLRRRADGQLDDRWLRTHERLGARVLRVEPHSQRVEARVEDWQRWSGQSFSASGDYAVREALRPVHINLETGLGEYFDPSVWMEHPHSPVSEYTWRPVEAGTLRQELRDSLPDYMVPEHIRFLSALPLTPSGKVDERALPELPLGPREPGRVVPPQGPVQERLAALWCDVLGLASVGVTDDFFELGGHSIHAIRLMARINEAFQVKLALRDLFRERTILGLEKRLAA
ncbi:non-ribosomal peptide synthetase [Stigmatella aurantiaca]|uniref:GrsB-like Gramicidin S synthetase 2 n=3 Tax=Stigmatella aurantiaca TaxID=41 RepID=E3FE23_STIAD|nr:non-ribosomal peptide synthetase [Stigmatella aurantiaca]ADO72626.1 GrsB-like Gramicidin S synthetase 2 [Stigmatella aurantiaca DW4/3-1]